MISIASSLHGGRILPDGVADAFGAGLGVLGVLLLLAVLAAVVYFGTLAYAWVPLLLLNRKRHLLWLLPLAASAGMLVLLWLAGDPAEPDVRYTWAEWLLLLAVPAASAAAAGLTLIVFAAAVARMRSPQTAAGPHRPTPG